MKAIRNTALVPSLPGRRRATRTRAPSRSARAVLLGVQAIDGMLRRVYDVREFTRDRRCLLRISRRASEYAVVLRDGTRIAAGDSLLELHLWNEHVPPFPPAGPTIGWAANSEWLVGHSLTLLAQHVAGTPTLADIRALHAVTPFASRQTRSKLIRLARRFGFETVEVPRRTWRRRIHQAASNVLIAGLVWAYNPHSFRGSKVVRDYVDLWMSLDALLARSAVPGRRD